MRKNGMFNEYSPLHIDGVVRVEPKLSMTFQPAAWNARDRVEKANCLAYALNEPALGWPYVGHLYPVAEDGSLAVESFKKERANTYAEQAPDISKHDAMVSRLQAAGLERIRQHQYGPDKRHIIAYTTYYGHFYRLDGNKVWSEKKGNDYARQLVHKGKGVRDLEHLNFWIPNGRGKTSLKPLADITLFALPKNGIYVRAPKPKSTTSPRYLSL